MSTVFYLPFNNLLILPHFHLSISPFISPVSLCRQMAFRHHDINPLHPESLCGLIKSTTFFQTPFHLLDFCSCIFQISCILHEHIPPFSLNLSPSWPSRAHIENLISRMMGYFIYLWFPTSPGPIFLHNPFPHLWSIAFHISGKKEYAALIAAYVQCT